MNNGKNYTTLLLELFLLEPFERGTIVVSSKKKYMFNKQTVEEK